MKLKFHETYLTVTREDGDPTYRSMSQGSWGSPESRLLYHIQKALKKEGHDLIKKRMWKDGHLVSDDQLYLRTRSKKARKPHICIWNGAFAIHDAALDLMKNGTTTLMVEQDIFQFPD